MHFIRSGDLVLAEYETDDLADVIAHALPRNYAAGDQIIRRKGDGDVVVAELELFGESKLWACKAGAFPETEDASDVRPICVR